MTIERDPHAGPVPDGTWEADAEARRERGRVEIFNATRPGGLDGWTMDLSRYEAVRGHILETTDDEAAADGSVRLQVLVDAARDRFGDHELFPNGRPTNDVRDTKTDLEARCEVERVPSWCPTDRPRPSSTVSSPSPTPSRFSPMAHGDRRDV